MCRRLFPSMSRCSQVFPVSHRYVQVCIGMCSYQQVLSSTIKEGVPLHQVCYHCLRHLDSREASDAGSNTCDTDSDVDESPSTVASSQYSTCQPRFCSSECRDMATVRYHLKSLMCSKLHVLCVDVFAGPDSPYLLPSKALLPHSTFIHSIHPRETTLTFSPLIWCAGDLL